MKKILFFTHYLTGGGAEKTIANLSAYMNENFPEYEVHIAVFFDDADMHDKLRRIHILPHKMPEGISKWKKIPILIKQIRDLKHLKKELNIDVCISFLPGADFLNALSKGREKMIISVRNKESFFVKTILKKWYLQYCYWKSDSIIAISERVRYDIIHFFGVSEDKVHTIYNPAPHINLTGEVNKDFEKLLEQNRQIVITAGRLTEQKGQKYLIQAFAGVLIQVPDAHLVILGKGELEEELKALAEKLNIQDSVSFLGFVKNPHDYIKKSKVFVFSSIVEGLGNILVETLACGTAIISTDCDCGPREILAPDTNWGSFTDKAEYAEYGILVPVRGETEMMEMITVLLRDERLRQSYRVKSKRRLADFSIENIVKQWLQWV